MRGAPVIGPVERTRDMIEVIPAALAHGYGEPLNSVWAKGLMIGAKP